MAQRQLFEELGIKTGRGELRPEHPASLMDTVVGEEWEIRNKHWKIHQNKNWLTCSTALSRKLLLAKKKATSSRATVPVHATTNSV